jgi:hypothetical protein
MTRIFLQNIYCRIIFNVGVHVFLALQYYVVLRIYFAKLGQT